MTSLKQRRDEILGLATKVIGSGEAANRWMRRPAYGLDNQTPAELIKTVAGTQLVETYLMQIEHSVFV